MPKTTPIRIFLDEMRLQGIMVRSCIYFLGMDICVNRYNCHDYLKARLTEGVVGQSIYFHNTLKNYTVSCHFWIETFHFFSYFFVFSSAVDNCNDSPCLNNGTCKHLQDGFSCDCAEGFTGLICQGDLVDIFVFSFEMSS